MSGRLRNFLLLLAFLAAFTLLTLLRGDVSVTPKFEETGLTVVGPKQFSYTVPYDQVASIELVTLEDTGTMRSGDENRNFYWGSWENDAWGQYTLCASKKFNTAILVTTLDGSRLVFNYEGDDTTVSMLQLFSDILENQTGKE